LILLDFPAEPGSTLRLQKNWGKPTQIWATDRIEDVRKHIDQAHAAALAGNWVVGFVSYEAAPAFDSAARGHVPVAGWPLAWFAVMGEEIPAPPERNFQVADWKDQTSAERFQQNFNAIKHAIQSGDTYQINFTTRLEAAFQGCAHSFFRALQRSQPMGYSLFIDLGARQICSVSPELFFHWEAQQLTTQPMKGTAARAPDPVRDEAIAQRLRGSSKEQAENLMIVDLLRNDMARLSLPGSVKVPRLFDLQALPTVWQMTSTIESRTRSGTRLSDIFQALFPCGSVTGAPKLKSMEIIHSLEPLARGIYCGALGVLQPGGTATFNVAIRTVSLQQQVATCGIGSGITWDAQQAQEQAEFQVKRRFLERAHAPFQLLETLKLSRGRFWLEDLHLQRMRRSAEYFNFDFSETAAKQALQKLAIDYPEHDWRVRLLLDAQGRFHAEVQPFEPMAAPVTIQLAQEPVNSSDEFLYHKTTWRTIYAPFVPKTAEVFDTLMWNEREELTEFTRGNVVLTVHGRDYTPPVSSGLLPGCLRQYGLQTGSLQERILTLQDLERAERVLFINSLRGSLATRWHEPMPP
jgi:para-aminobenzoate synthetase/4-amino-4-deoxychorismate lyase